MQLTSLLRNWLIIISLSLLVSCQPSVKPDYEYVLHGNTMGTYYTVKFYATEQPVDSKQLQKLIDSELELVNDLMSTYRPHSELVRFNQHNSSEPFPLSEGSRQVIAEALRLGEQSGGVIDITVGPLVGLWGFGAKGQGMRVPTDEQLLAVREHVGLDKLQLTDAGLIKYDPRVELDLSTIAKGYGVDKVAELLERQDIVNYLVDIGGEMRLKGTKPEQAWRVAIEKPTGDGRSVQRILLPGDMAVATSGDYRIYFEQDGVRYSHLIDPRTGKPIQHQVVSATVLHPSAMTADGYATVLIVLDQQSALNFANSHGLAALLIVKTEDGFAELVSDALKPYLTE